jgi:hypothetical protein
LKRGSKTDCLKGEEQEVAPRFSHDQLKCLPRIPDNFIMSSGLLEPKTFASLASGTISRLFFLS